MAATFPPLRNYSTSATFPTAIRRCSPPIERERIRIGQVYHRRRNSQECSLLRVERERSLCEIHESWYLTDARLFTKSFTFVRSCQRESDLPCVRSGVRYLKGCESYPTENTLQGIKSGLLIDLLSVALLARDWSVCDLSNRNRFSLLCCWSNLCLNLASLSCCAGSWNSKYRSLNAGGGEYH